MLLVLDVVAAVSGVVVLSAVLCAVLIPDRGVDAVVTEVRPFQVIAIVLTCIKVTAVPVVIVDLLLLVLLLMLLLILFL